ncbi:ATP-binding protein [Streptomyces sp. SLBN-134]|uniref:ATP-binding protein n=1 Tax=Streptomyces sp. SLBN-134 TaxID=2768456 RepID=UPI0021B1E838|nr:ATP-binding protein [Streptomyces sp. SLBN-134]
MLVVDEAQRLPVPCLEYLQSLWDYPGARITLVLCCAVLCCAGRAASGRWPGCRS